MNFWIKFHHSVPPPSDNFGVKIHGDVDNSWVSSCKPHHWYWVSVVGKATGDDGNHVLVIFDTVSGPREVDMYNLHCEVFQHKVSAKPAPVHRTAYSTRQ